MNPAVNDFVFKHSPFIPYDPTVNPVYTGYTTHPALGGVQPFVYTDWRNEELSWHENCYIHAGLNPINETHIEGPDAVKLLEHCLTNGFKKFPIGGIKHAIAVTREGHLLTDGILIRLGENEFHGSNLSPWLDWNAMVGDYDVEVRDVTGEAFTFQLGGPRSLEIVESACQADFHDVGFLRIKNGEINGIPVRVLRIGMAGSLAYEVSGKFEDSVPVYQALIAAGEPFGITKLGRHAYWNTHTENGFPQAIIHFPYAYEEEPEYFQYLLDTRSTWLAFAASTSRMGGSMGTDFTKRFVNPYELDWGRSVVFNHDFVGREALEKMRNEPQRRVVTLEWDKEDVVDIWRSTLEEGEPYAILEGPEDYDESGHYTYVSDQVISDGRCIGTSTGRCHSWYYRKMISLGLVEPGAVEEGDEVTIIWGGEGTRQKEIRATVARYPYMNVDRNECVDVMERVPRRFA